MPKVWTATTKQDYLFGEVKQSSLIIKKIYIWKTGVGLLEMYEITSWNKQENIWDTWFLHDLTLLKCLHLQCY